ncbi:hydrolase TatD [candidate division WOR-3 bacterium]|uniref:Hydrolase TatD n=1 Tax=candidate division WOR-3 bacterium TaxID=2052148 RepID=A0A660SER7_UNCW3|nr:MAG: hydrolase TatD [candidate division WOR-3 bacterium]
MILFDTHCHLADPKLFPHHREIINRARDSGVRYLLTVGYDGESNQKSVEIARGAKGVYAAVGIHPNEEGEVELPEDPEIVAIGETGLDYYRDQVNPKAQIEKFIKHIEIARDRELPLIIHTRKAFPDLIAILKGEGYYHGVCHCFSGDEAIARKLTDLGLYISFSGSLTYGSKRLENALTSIPLNRLLFETDSPYLSPLKGKVNEPANLRFIIAHAASILRMDPEELASITTENGKILFRI